MFEKVSQLAEQVATSVSRREFLGRFGRGAMVLAATAGGLLALPGIGHAGRQPRLCGEGSCCGCYAGSHEGDSCSADDAFGTCQGPKRGGDKSTVTICACVTRSRR